MGSIVGGVIAPHPPHLVYAENPSQNEPRSEGGWEVLRWGYERLRGDLPDHDVVVLLSPHWQTYVGTHFLGLPRFASKSVDPIFPNLFRFTYDLSIDVALAESVEEHARESGLVTAMMRNPDFRVDYGTIVSAHLLNPAWDKPLVALSSQRSTHYYSVEVMQEQALALAAATRRACLASGKRCLLVASNSLSHRHFTTESELPEDMSREHVTSHAMYLWDMKMLKLMREGRSREAVDVMPEFISQAISEADAGAMTWLLAALDYPEKPAEVYAYGTVIGTGNAVVGWF